MPIIVILTALIAAVLLGSLATAVSHSYVLILAGSAVLAVFAFLSPRASLVILLFSMLLSPEIGFGDITATRSVILRYDDIVLMIIFLSWFARTAIMKGRAFITQSPVQTPVLIYTALCVVSTSLGIMRGDVRFNVAFFYVLKYVEYFLLYFMAVNIADSKEEVKKYLAYGLVIAVIVTIYAYYYYYSSGAGARATAPFEAPIGRPQDSEPASLGGYYLLVFGILLGLLTEYSGKIMMWTLAALAFMFPAFLLTFSRASYIGLAALFAALLLLSERRKTLLGFFMAGLFAFGMFMPGLSGPVRERVSMTYQGAYAVKDVQTGFGTVKLEESAWLRIASIRGALFDKLPKHPIMGWGVTGAGMGDTQYTLLIGELGVAGTFVFFWMLYRIFSSSRRVYSAFEEKWIKALALGVMVAVPGLLFQAVGVNTFIIVRIMEPLWFLSAMIMVLCRIADREKAPPESAAAAPKAGE
ncbi:MAG: hypothetical protein A2049_03325 [Elusimicrobia bacterium GWA2_62_23]|nr:MAG: hypothetical protein A2049_03325 [Elusimicrobia bacterium GWA2_62_23]HBB65912.1 hypothetical protein [Elusimicrobiota bacterium]